MEILWRSDPSDPYDGFYDLQCVDDAAQDVLDAESRSLRNGYVYEIDPVSGERFDIHWGTFGDMLDEAQGEPPILRRRTTIWPTTTHTLALSSS